MRNFRELKVWQDAIQITKRVYKLCSKLPKEENFGLVSQIRRCSVSIPSNIAEGCSRNTAKEFERFINIAIGSAFELETQIIITVEVEYFTKTKVEPLLKDLTTLQKRLNALRKSIR